MGWCSWYAQGPAVTEVAVRAAADALVGSGLARLGFDLVAIDDGWQGRRSGPRNALQPNERFADMGRLAADLHRRGLRLGLYTTPWMASYAGFIGGSSPDPEGDGTDGRLVLPQSPGRLPTQFYGPHPGSERLGLRHVGHWMLDRDLAQLAEWGVDHVKLDWHPVDPPTAARIRTDLSGTGRPMQLSLSNAVRLEDAPAIAALADTWRTTGDIVDTWESVCGIARYQLAWNPWRTDRHRPDPDMLQLGWLRDPADPDAPARPSRLTRAEQRFQVGVWCLLGAPLLLSCDLRRLDAATLGLLTDPVALGIGRAPMSGSPGVAWESDRVEAWVRTLGPRRRAVGLLNLTDGPQRVRPPWGELLGTAGTWVRRAWDDRGPRPHAPAVELELPAHGLALLESVPSPRAD
jgi:alpha-galactosidase